MNIKTTQQYFGLSTDVLLVTDEYTYTKEEKLLFDEGLKVTFFDDMQELEGEKEEFEKWMNEQEFEYKVILETVNGRIAVVLH